MDWVRPAGGGLFLNICFSSFGSVMCCRAGGGHCRFPIVFLQTPRQALTPPSLNGWPHAPMMGWPRPSAAATPAAASTSSSSARCPGCPCLRPGQPCLSPVMSPRPPPIGVPCPPIQGEEGSFLGFPGWQASRRDGCPPAPGRPPGGAPARGGPPGDPRPADHVIA